MSAKSKTKTPLIGIFGGTFDPIHFGHLRAVNELNQYMQFSCVHWVLSARPPHKDRVGANVEQRFDMLQRALQSYPSYIADDTEVKRPQKSYAIDTVAIFRDRYPHEKLFLIIGGDSLLELHIWHRYLELIDQVHLIVMARPGYAREIPDYLSDRVSDSVIQLSERSTPGLAIFEQTDYDISSTQIRALLRQGLDSRLEEMLPESVIDYIRNTQSYKMVGMNPEQIKDQVVLSLENIKGQDIRVIDIAEISDFADYMIVVSGTSDTHVKALAREASNNLRKQGTIPINEDGAELGEWVLVDFGDVVLHVMRPEVREYYDLEKLWDEDVRQLVKQHREQQDG